MNRVFSPSRLIRAAVALLCGVCACALGGCGGVGIKAGPYDSPTRGASLRMLVSDGRSSHVLYDVDAEGTFSFAGGWDALNERFTWSNALSQEQLASLERLLRENGWYNGPPSAGESNDSRKHDISFAWPSGSWHASAEGGGPGIDPVRVFLENAASKRHEEYLDRLPKEGKLE